MEHELLEKKLAYPYENGQANKSFYKPLNSGREDCFSTLRQTYPDFEEVITKSHSWRK